MRQRFSLLHFFVLLLLSEQQYHCHQYDCYQMLSKTTITVNHDGITLHVSSCDVALIK